MLDKAIIIRRLNDEFRKSPLQLGVVYVTEGVAALEATVIGAILQTVAEFDAFDANNDTHGERDFGTFAIDGVGIFFKIEYYDQTMEALSPDPTDTAVTTRVLTIMLHEDY